MKTARRWVLLDPGPVNVTEGVRHALLGPDVCHREKEFLDTFKGVRGKLLRILGISRTHKAVFLAGSGTLAVEAMLTSYNLGNGKILLLSNGVYGDRMERMLRVHGIRHRVLKSPLGSFPTAASINTVLEKDSEIKAVAMVHLETSTGMLNPLPEAGALARDFKKDLLLDAVSSLGAEAVAFKKLGITMCAGSGGKCLHSFPGISFVLAANKALGRIRRGKPRTLYMDLGHLWDFQKNGTPPFTPPVQLFYALDRALDELRAEGLSNRIRSYREKARFLHEGLARTGLSFLVPPERRSHVLTALWMPKGQSYGALHDRLKKKGFIIYAGQSKLAGKIFRVAHLGAVTVQDVNRFVKTLAVILRRARTRHPEPAEGGRRI